MPTPLPVRLGRRTPDGISPSMYALVERGVSRRPEMAAGMSGTVEIRFREGFAPVRVDFGASEVVVEDGDSPDEPDLVIEGSLPDIVQLISVPLTRGVPRPTSGRGRAALASVAGGRVRIRGDRPLGRRLLRLLQI